MPATTFAAMEQIHPWQGSCTESMFLLTGMTLTLHIWQQQKKIFFIKKKSGNAVGKEEEQNHSDASYLGRLSEHFTHEITCISTGSRQALKM